MYKIIAENRDDRMEKCKILHDRVVRAAEFKIGDYVLVLDKTPQKRGQNASIRKKWTGPWEIELIYNDVNYALKSFHTRRVLFRTVHQCMLKKWHGPAVQHAKFKTTHHRERESKSGKIVLNTQDSNVETQKQNRSQSQGNLQVEQSSHEKTVKRLKQQAKAAGDVGEQNANANGNNGLVTRFGRTTKAPDFFKA